MPNIKIQVRIDQEDIDDSERGNCTRCMTAVAVTRATSVKLEKPVYASIGNSIGEIYEVEGGRTYELGNFTLPHIARRNIREYDMGLRVEPFEFPVDLFIYNERLPLAPPPLSLDD